MADIVFYHEEDKTDPALAVRVIEHERRRGLRKALKVWHEDGVRRIVVPVGILRETTCTHVLEEVASETGLTVEDYPWRPGDSTAISKRLFSKRHGVRIFSSGVFRT